MRCQHVLILAVTPHLAGSSQARLPLFPGNELANIEQVMSVCRVELETNVREVFTVPEEGYKRFLETHVGYDLCTCVPISCLPYVSRGLISIMS